MGAMPRLGQGNLRAARDAADRRLRGHRKFDGIYLGRRKGKDLVYAGKIDPALTSPQRSACRRG